MIRFLFLLVLTYTLSSPVRASDQTLFKNGHIKSFFSVNTFPDDSLFLQHVETPSTDLAGDLRLNFGVATDALSFIADYQLITSHGDSIIISNALAGSPGVSDSTPDDDNRLFDLTHVFSQDSNQITVHRLDRIYLNITSKNTVARFGRQAISWGNGLIYSPMDFFNPFDPSSIDTEYKTGDDMLYGQYLQPNGDDLQAVWVIRRDVNHRVSSDVGSIAAKYHGFSGSGEYDILLAKHFDDTIIGAGGIIDVGSAIWRGDITLTETQTQRITSLVTSLSYSWIGWGHNISGVVELFYNGFGQTRGNYSPANLVINSDLTDRLSRGELFTLGRNYIAASATIEISPLWMLTPNVFLNADDHSAFAQLVSTYNLKQEWQLLTAVGIPFGKTGTEFGGIESSVPGKTLGTDLNIYAQLSWYY